MGVATLRRQRQIRVAKAEAERAAAEAVVSPVEPESSVVEAIAVQEPTPEAQPKRRYRKNG